MIRRTLMFTTVGEVLSQIDTIPEFGQCGYTLYVPEGALVLDEHMPCAVLLTTGNEPAGYVPPFARNHRLEAAVDVQLVREIVDHARMQKPVLTGADVVEALNYYLDNDAFFDFGVESRRSAISGHP